MRKRPKTLARFLIRKYLMTSLLLLSLTIIFMSVIQFFISGTNQIAAKLCAEEIVRPDYQNIDTQTLEDVGGWLEILDETNRVIYTKGDVQEKHKQYTQNQLLETEGLRAMLKKDIYQFGPISFEVNQEAPKYMATFASFIGDDGNHYLCVTKMPSRSIRGNFTPVFTNVRSATFFSIFGKIVLLLIPILFIFIFCLWRYSKSVREHIIAPNNILIDGFRSIRNGDYSKKIHLNAEYEYVEIEETFNHMAHQLKEAEELRKAYEKERQLIFANMAHDLRTPITTIKGSAKAVEDGLVSQEDLGQVMATILSKTDHMNELVNRLLIFSKLESPEYQLQLQPLDLSELLRQVILEQWECAEENGITFEIDLPEAPIEISGDSVELRRVFDNLISNSIHHNPAGTTVHVQLTASEDHVVFTITDDGSRIPKDLQPQLFDPFVSGDRSRSTKGGSGLGLAISKKIVEKHGGRISFKELSPHQKLFQVRL
ncbi:hypothetical protein NRIC_25180 [Enterococcus florum]|uniref:histidine kinase n=1 Tax=Enterococcus florum TaxID=2480627 RepID=A0A4P5P988_9ENTE|nr:HAMP domain-containing sensor histidine kinase [Enterococcus florum]GCF94627.1 hypothetical protein NRIC_25180 [Enterococcus florum]